MAFTGRTVIVTGAGQGIGREVAMEYAKAGARVVVAEWHEDKGEAVARRMRERGWEALFVRTDVRREEDVVRLMDETVKAYGRIDVLINNAGIFASRPLFELAVEEWDDVIQTNLRGTFLCAREAARRMREQGGGAIVNIASTRALMSEPDTEAYAASKGGVVALTHALAVSLGPYRIRVNCISPGWIETGDYGRLTEADHRQHPAQRVGRPMDIVRACFYLTHPENDFVTGVNLVVDGGMTRKMIYVE